MLPDRLITSHLVDASQRRPVVVAKLRRPSRLRTWFVLYQLLRLASLSLWLRMTMRLSPAAFARRVRGLLERLGPVWVKAGQLMGMRSDLLPVDFAAELARFRDRGPGFPFAAAKAVVEEELQRPLEDVFDQFQPAPFAAAAGFQLHRARLRREQTWVAVKILRPDSQWMFRHDFHLMCQVAGWLRRFHVQTRMRWNDLCREIREAMVRELDLRYEASSLDRLRGTLPRHGIYVPEVFFPYCTPRVLVMEFIHGALISDYVALRQSEPRRLAAWLDENNIRPRTVARRLFHSLWRQVFEDNLFHADMNPYNVVLLRDSRLAVIDCRGVGSLEAENLDKHRMVVQALAAGEYATAAERSFLLAFRLPQVDLGEVKAQFVRVWRRWENRNYVRQLPPEQRSLTRMFDELNRIMYRSNFEVDWSMAKFAWTQVNADISILHLAPDINYLVWLRQYFRAADRRANRIDPRELVERASALAGTVRDLPRTISESTMAIQDIMRRQARVLRGSTTKTGYFLATLYDFLAMATLVVGACFACALLEQHSGAPLQRVLGDQLTQAVRALPALDDWAWVVLLMVVLYCHRRFTLLKRSFLRQTIHVRQSGRLP